MAKKGKKFLDAGDRVHITFPPVKPIMIDKLKRLVNLSKWITEAVEYLYGNNDNIDTFYAVCNDVNGQIRDNLCYRIPSRISAKALEALQKDRYAVMRDSIMFLVGIIQSSSGEKSISDQDKSENTGTSNLHLLMANYEDIMSI